MLLVDNLFFFFFLIEKIETVCWELTYLSSVKPAKRSSLAEGLAACFLEPTWWALNPAAQPSAVQP